MMDLLRAALFNIYFFGMTAIMSAAGAPVRWFAPARSLNARSLGLAKAWVRTILWGLRTICRIRVAVTGAEHLPRSGACLIASQHQSAFDTMVWMTLLPLPTYVVKQELTRIPLFGKLLVTSGQIPVDRSGGSGALRQMLHEAAGAAKAGRQIVIFPEGTRATPGAPVVLQPGVAGLAARLAIPVIPVATDSGRHWARRAFRKRAGIIHIAVGTPIAHDTTRADMLRAIEAWWRANEDSNFSAVDSSVEKPAFELQNTNK